MSLSTEIIHNTELHGLWKTERTNLAAYLISNGLEPKAVRWENGTAYWYFEHSAEVLTHSSTFIRGEARVEPISFGSLIKSLTKKMYEARSWGTA